MTKIKQGLLDLSPQTVKELLNMASKIVKLIS